MINKQNRSLAILRASKLCTERKEAAKKLGLLLKDSSNQLISSPKTTQALQDIYLKTYTEEEIQANLKFLKTPEIPINYP